MSKGSSIAARYTKEYKRLSDSHKVQAMLDGPGGFASAIALNVRGPHFFSHTANDGFGKFALCYAILRSDGNFDIAAQLIETYGSDSKKQKAELYIGTLDHIPIEGERAFGWVPYTLVNEELVVNRERAIRYMADISLMKAPCYFTSWEADLGDVSLDPHAERHAPADAKFVVCNIAADAIRRQENGMAIVSVPCSLDSTGVAFVLVADSEIIEDEWRVGKKTLVLDNAPNREYSFDACNELDSSERQIGGLQISTSLFVGAVKQQEERNRKAKTSCEGEGPYRPLAQVWPLPPAPSGECVVIGGIEPDAIEDTSIGKKVAIPFDLANDAKATLYVNAGEVMGEASEGGGCSVRLDPDYVYILDVSLSAGVAEAQHLNVERSLGIDASSATEVVRICMPPTEIKRHARVTGGRFSCHLYPYGDRGTVR